MTCRHSNMKGAAGRVQSHLTHSLQGVEKPYV